jgi:hypothetical protein
MFVALKVVRRPNLDYSRTIVYSDGINESLSHVIDSETNCAANRSLAMISTSPKS